MPINLKLGNIDTQKTNEIFIGNRFSVLQGVDPNPENFVAAAVLHMSTSGKVGCLVRYEPNKDAKVRILVLNIELSFNAHYTACSLNFANN